MLALVAHLVLYPLVPPASAWLYARAGREMAEPPRWAVRLSLAVYLAAALVLATAAVLGALAR